MCTMIKERRTPSLKVHKCIGESRVGLLYLWLIELAPAPCGDSNELTYGSCGRSAILELDKMALSGLRILPFGGSSRSKEKKVLFCGQ